MLKLDLDPSFWADVKFKIAGRAQPATVPFEFKAMARPEYEAWIKKNREPIGYEPLSDDVAAAFEEARKRDPSLERPKGKPILRADIDILMEICLNWRDVDGVFNRENLHRFISAYQHAPDAIYFTYRDELEGIKKKN